MQNNGPAFHWNSGAGRSNGNGDADPEFTAAGFCRVRMSSLVGVRMSSPSLVPSLPDADIYLVLDDFGSKVASIARPTPTGQTAAKSCRLC